MKLAIVTLNKASITIAKNIKAKFDISNESNDENQNVKLVDTEITDIDIYTLDKYLEEGIKPIVGKLKAFSKELFEKYDCLIYVMAMGIIVRDIAPFLIHKSSDPAVICVSVDGRFVIPVLSGHLGGANALANIIAKNIHAIPVITTASDLLGVEAVDLIAKRYDLVIDSFKTAMDLTARMINEEAIAIITDTIKPIEEATSIPSDKLHQFLEEDQSDGYVYIGYHKSIDTIKPIAKLIPKRIVIGVGARRNISFQAIDELLVNIFKENNLDIRAIKSFYSIDLKQDELGIVEVANALGVPFETYRAEQLKEVSDRFEQSDFVESITGVGCVSMPSGYLGSNKGKCVVNKIASKGITISVWEEL